jgi:hypothetical protein
MALSDFCVLDYINARLMRLGVELSEVELMAIGFQIMPDVQFSDVMNADNIRKSDKTCLFAIKDILLMPDIQEGGYSIKHDKDSLAKWYNSEVQRLGLGSDPAFNIMPKVRDASNRW